MDIYNDLLNFPTYKKSYDSHAKIYLLVEKTDGFVLSEDLAFLIPSGKKLEFESFPFMLFEIFGYINKSPVYTKCNNEEYDLVIASDRIMNTYSLTSCLKERYRFFGTIGEFRIYYPNRIPRRQFIEKYYGSI